MIGLELVYKCYSLFLFKEDPLPRKKKKKKKKQNFPLSHKYLKIKIIFPFGSKKKRNKNKISRPVWFGFMAYQQCQIMFIDIY